MKNASVSQPCTQGCGGAATTSYDANGNATSRADFNGNVSIYSYDLTRNLETSRTEASGTPQTRTITTQWHPTFHLPANLTEPGRVTDFAYDATGNLIQKTITAGSQTRTWAYTYNANGQVVTADGPRTDKSDVTTYVYDISGNPTTVTNAAGHVTSITSYDAHGRPLSITDANGLITNLSYDAMGRLTSMNVGGQTTSHTYDGVGQLSSISLPTGAILSYAYDAAHRLTDVQDLLGNKIHYTLDLLGNRVKEDVSDPGNSLRQTRSRMYDVLNRLQKDIGGTNPATQVTQYGYDNNGNLLTVTDPLNHVVTNAYDAVNHLVQTTDPGNGATRYGYTALDQLASVIDPRNHVTTYAPDGLNNVTQTVSPDTGTSTATYDAAGNVLTRKDAKNQTTTYQYDALNRLTHESRADGSAVTYTYDGGTNQKGRLTGIADSSGSTTFAYDLWGRVRQKSQVMGGVTRTTQYTYDTTGQLTQITYPSGKVVNYLWASGKVTSVTLGTTNPTTIASGIAYQPFGPVKSWVFGNGQVINRSFDLDGRMTGTSLGGITYDAASRITSLNLVFAARTYGYDALDRLTGYTDPTGNGSYSYDATGNRSQSVIGATINNYTVRATNNQVTKITTGAQTANYSYDANGTITGDGTYTYAYSALGRLTQVKQGSSVKGVYTVNALGQRVKKVAGNATTLFAYDEAGHLIGEYNGSGTLVAEHVWLGDTPIAVLTASATYYVHTDHLNAPRQVFNQTQTKVWLWDYASFGSGVANQNPAGAGTFTYNLRFPGQYYDAETGLHHNYFRDYDPKTGRYIESDPIGLAGGINTYTHVKDPLTEIDPFGLMGSAPGSVFARPQPRTGPICPCPPVPQKPATASCDDNVKDAKHSYNPFWFYHQVQNKGPWDYKQQGTQYQDFGNFNYGASGAAFGFPDKVSLRMAGWAQVQAGTSLPQWGKPWGSSPYGDDPADQALVQQGIEYYRCRCYK